MFYVDEGGPLLEMVSSTYGKVIPGGGVPLCFGTRAILRKT